MDTPTLPPPDAIRNRMALCRRELAALRKLLRMSMALRQADDARSQRATDRTPAPAGGGDRGAA
jgi:hypothetical protein